jgi:hypothetical protein
MNYCVLASLTGLLAISSQATIRGMNPLMAVHYGDPSIFKCLDGSKVLSRAAVNDDFCDCQDGSDEPGTSACPNGHFYCPNSGHIPSSIPSSRVNDGICESECCDGSDEFSSGVKCPNVCDATHHLHRQEEEARIKIYEEGIRLRQEYSSYGRQMKQQWKTELEDIEMKLAATDTEFNRLTALKSKLEHAERVTGRRHVGIVYKKLSQTKGYLEDLKTKLDFFDQRMGDVRDMITDSPESDLATLKAEVASLTDEWQKLNIQSLLYMPLLTDTDVESDNSTYGTGIEQSEADDPPIPSWKLVFSRLYDGCAQPILSLAQSLFAGEEVSFTEYDEVKTGKHVWCFITNCVCRTQLGYVKTRKH